jgi:hypothetical protein
VCINSDISDWILAVLGRGAPTGGGAAGLQPAAKRPKTEIKKHRFCRYYDIKSFTWFILQPKSATEIG